MAQDWPLMAWIRNSNDIKWYPCFNPPDEQLKSLLMEETDEIVHDNQYHGCSWPGEARNQGINSNGMNFSQNIFFQYKNTIYSEFMIKIISPMTFNSPASQNRFFFIQLIQPKTSVITIFYLFTQMIVPSQSSKNISNSDLIGNHRFNLQQNTHKRHQTGHFFYNNPINIQQKTVNFFHVNE